MVFADQDEVKFQSKFLENMMRRKYDRRKHGKRMILFAEEYKDTLEERKISLCNSGLQAVVQKWEKSQEPKEKSSNRKRSLSCSHLEEERKYPKPSTHFLPLLPEKYKIPKKVWDGKLWSKYICPSE